MGRHSAPVSRRPGWVTQWFRFRQSRAEQGVVLTALAIIGGSSYVYASGQGVQQTIVVNQSPEEILAERMSDGGDIEPGSELPEALRAILPANPPQSVPALKRSDERAEVRARPEPSPSTPAMSPQPPAVIIEAEPDEEPKPAVTSAQPSPTTTTPSRPTATPTPSPTDPSETDSPTATPAAPVPSPSVEPTIPDPPSTPSPTAPGMGSGTGGAGAGGGAGAPGDFSASQPGTPKRDTQSEGTRGAQSVVPEVRPSMSSGGTTPPDDAASSGS